MNNIVCDSITEVEDKIPVIVSVKNSVNFLQYKNSSLDKKIKCKLPIINGYACELSKAQIEELKKDKNINFVTEDSQIQIIINSASKTVNVDYARNLDVTGNGVTIASIDTGIAPHKDLIEPSNKIIGFKDFVDNQEKPYDDNGHGTHTAGLMCGSGLSSKGKYIGIAPNAKILAVKALDNQGNGKVSDILRAVQWIIETKEKYNTRILNLSLGTPPTRRESFDPLVIAANKAIENGLVVICAVGNSGPQYRSILSPATGRQVISVGACNDKTDNKYGFMSIPKFSSRGPTNEGITKPDLVAPGVSIMSLSSEDLKGYIPLSGTSMAAPIIAGIVALLLEKKPFLNHFQVKRILKNSCVRISNRRNEEGAGMIRIDKMLKLIDS